MYGVLQTHVGWEMSCEFMCEGFSSSTTWQLNGALKNEEDLGIQRGSLREHLFFFSSTALMHLGLLWVPSLYISPFILPFLRILSLDDFPFCSLSLGSINTMVLIVTSVYKWFSNPFLLARHWFWFLDISSSQKFSPLSLRDLLLLICYAFNLSPPSFLPLASLTGDKWHCSTSFFTLRSKP